MASFVHTAAQSQETLALESFSERLSKDVPVSGRMLVGAAAVLSSEAGKVPALLTPSLLWQSANEPLCVTLASRDGQYYGEGKLSAEKLRGRAGSVPIKGEHQPSSKDYLNRLPQNELAVLASTGDCRSGTAPGISPTIHVVDHRVARPSGGDGGKDKEFTLLLLLNSMTYTLDVEVKFPDRPKDPKQATCIPFDDAKRNKAFNTRCTLTVTNALTNAELVIKRRRYERGFDPIRFKLAWSPL
jgi:hypothetical protein